MEETECDNRKFIRYCTIKNRFKIDHQGFNIQNLIAHDIARFSFNNSFPKIKSVVRFFTVPDYRFFLKKLSKSQIVFTVLYPERMDHRQLIESVRNEIKEPTEVLDYSVNKKIKVVFNCKNIFNSIRFVLKEREYLSVKELLYYSASLTYYKNLLDVLEKYVKPHLALKSFVAFNSSGTPDNVLALFLRNNGIPTYSLQHAAFVNFKRQIPADIIIVENMTAEKMLCWGEDSYRLLHQFGYNSDRYVLAGNPKYKGTSFSVVKQSFNSGLILLGRWIYDKENLELLTILKEYNKKYPKIRFKVKLHPSLDEKKYQDWLNGSSISLITGKVLLSDLFRSGEFDFAITYNTSAYYEPMTEGIPSLRFAKNENEVFTGLDDKFETLGELIEIIEQIKAEDPIVLKQRFEGLLRNVFGYDIINYSEILS